MTDDEKAAAFETWWAPQSEYLGSPGIARGAFMAGVAAAEARITMLERQRNALLAEKDATISRLRKLLEPFAAYCKLISAEVPDDTQLVRRGAPDVGHCRAARDELRKGKKA